MNNEKSQEKNQSEEEMKLNLILNLLKSFQNFQMKISHQLNVGKNNVLKFLLHK
jgi:hypothetical protein